MGYLEKAKFILARIDPSETFLLFGDYCQSSQFFKEKEKELTNITSFITFSCRSFNTHQGFSIELSKEYYYRTLVIANIDNNVALTRCFESCEVWPLKIKLTLLRV